MKISCLKFASAAVLREFICRVYPFVVEELDNILCGVFSDAEILIAQQDFNASLLGTSPARNTRS
ncbi:MAG TPA: hypothetical protein VGN63_15560 [Flavisolibacter sp.]|jgi:hypothetical protein|nr:hypothetical protein [Flavisolibacter sp.]